MVDLRHATGSDVRRAVRDNKLRGQTSGLAMGFVQANLVVVPKELAFDFLLFCTRNPKPCPLLEVTNPGNPRTEIVARDADLSTDLPRYCMYKDGELVEELNDLRSVWRPDLVGFLLGCSFTFENALLKGKVPVRHIEMERNVPMYRTNIPLRSAGAFHGNMVVSMRPMTATQALEATAICARYPRAHGTPIHAGDPAAIGIRDIDRPEYGDPVEIRPGESPVFWACGVTPQAVARHAKPSLLFSHKPGHMFLTDMLDSDLEGL